MFFPQVNCTSCPYLSGSDKPGHCFSEQGEGALKGHNRCEPLENINQGLDAMKAGTIEGRVVLDLTQ